jgi:hypothetical protein
MPLNTLISCPQEFSLKAFVPLLYPQKNPQAATFPIEPMRSPQMDTNWMYVIIVLILAVIAIVAFFRFRHRTNIDVRGPFGTGVKVDAANEVTPPPATVKGEKITSRKGGLTAHNEVGGDVDVKDVDVEQDVDLKSTAIPKAPPPA